MKPLNQIIQEKDAGERLIQGLMRATDRDKIAQGIRDLRKWRHRILTVTGEYDVALSASLRPLLPTPDEWARIRCRDYPSRAQLLMLMCAETTLTRIQRYLNRAERVPPEHVAGKRGRKKGDGSIPDDQHVQKVLAHMSDGMSAYSAAGLVVDQGGVAGASPQSSITRLAKKAKALQRQAE